MSFESDPRNQSDNNNERNTDRISSDAIRRNLASQQPQDIPRWVKWGGAGLVAAIGIGGAAYGIGYLGAKGQLDAVRGASGSDRYTSSSEIPGSHGEYGGELNIDNATPSEFFSDAYFTDEERVQWADEQLNAPSQDPQYPNMTAEQATYQRILYNLAQQDRPEELIGKLVEPSITNTANEANIIQMVAYAAGVFENDSDKGEKMIAAGIDNGHPRVDDIRDDTRRAHLSSDAERLRYNLGFSFVPGDAMQSEKAGHKVEMASPYSTDRPIGSIVPQNGIPTRVALIVTNGDPDDSEEIQTFIGGRWTANDNILETNGRWIPHNDLVDILK
ncbi:MAG: hypothetical protein WAW80_05105 [Candidatus Saccharimonadales bacterium]